MNAYSRSRDRSSNAEDNSVVRDDNVRGRVRAGTGARATGAVTMNVGTTKYL